MSVCHLKKLPPQKFHSGPFGWIFSLSNMIKVVDNWLKDKTLAKLSCLWIVRRKIFWWLSAPALVCSLSYIINMVRWGMTRSFLSQLRLPLCPCSIYFWILRKYLTRLASSIFPSRKCMGNVFLQNLFGLGLPMYSKESLHRSYTRVLLDWKRGPFLWCIFLTFQ